jgi:hypothetical protein
MNAAIRMQTFQHGKDRGYDVHHVTMDEAKSLTVSNGKLFDRLGWL